MIAQVLFRLLKDIQSDFALNPIIWTAVILAAGGFPLTYPAGVLIDLLLKPFQKQLNKKFRPNSLRPVTGLKNGGRIIGYLERLLIFVFIVSGQFAGVGFLVAAKSIFRFGELKDSENRKQAEYIIIGTMLSFAWGLVAAWLTQYVLQNI